MSRVGSFDRSGAGPELYVGCRERREVAHYIIRSDSGGLRNPQTSAQLFGIDLGPDDGVGPGGVG